jgi:hypothetical protein
MRQNVTDRPNRRRLHWTIIGAWSALLVVTAAVCWDRLSSGGHDTASADAGGTGLRPSELSPILPMEGTVTGIHQALKSASPGYNGRGQFQMTGGKVTVADLSGTGIVDPLPLRELPLEALDLSENPVADLSGLRGMPLRRLALEGTEVTDLSPLQGMPLSELYLNRTRIDDLSPLAGMPLELLNLYETNVNDLSPLRGMPIRMLWLNGTKVSDISPIAGCPLVSLTLERTPVADLSPLTGSTIERLHIGQTPVLDLTPLAETELTRLIFTPPGINKGLEIVRNMASIREIGATLEKRMRPKEFWAIYDKGGIR